MSQPLLQFSGVKYGKINGFDFVLEGGSIHVLRVSGKEEKNALIDLAVGERQPVEGSVFLAGEPLVQSTPGCIGWVADTGGLVSNLKVWENVTLPLWYHSKPQPDEAERTTKRWLEVLGVEGDAMTAFMSSPPSALSSLERKRAGLLRGLLLSPSLMVLDGALFNNVSQAERTYWVAALETLVNESNNMRSVLVVALEGDVMLPAWVDNKKG